MSSKYTSSWKDKDQELTIEITLDAKGEILNFSYFEKNCASYLPLLNFLKNSPNSWREYTVNSYPLPIELLKRTLNKYYGELISPVFKNKNDLLCCCFGIYKGDDKSLMGLGCGSCKKYIEDPFQKYGTPGYILRTILPDLTKENLTVSDVVSIEGNRLKLSKEISKNFKECYSFLEVEHTFDKNTPDAESY